MLVFNWILFQASIKYCTFFLTIKILSLSDISNQTSQLRWKQNFSEGNHPVICQQILAPWVGFEPAPTVVRDKMSLTNLSQQSVTSDVSSKPTDFV